MGVGKEAGGGCLPFGISLTSTNIVYFITKIIIKYLVSFPSVLQKNNHGCFLKIYSPSDTLLCISEKRKTITNKSPCKIGILSLSN